MERATNCHYCPRWLAVLWLMLGFGALLFVGGCRTSVSAADTTPRLGGARATINGTVRGPDGALPVSGRTVDIVNIATGERRTTVTSPTGGFTSQLPAGKYRLELPLRDGETLIAQPDVVDLVNGVRDSQVEFVLGASRVIRPRGPGYRVENGLGAPMA